MPTEIPSPTSSDMQRHATEDYVELDNLMPWGGQSAFADQVGQVWIRRHKALEADNAKLQSWIDDLQSGMSINCVYCGHCYGPNDGDHLATMRDALEAHISECPKHPLSAALADNADLRQENENLKGQLAAANDQHELLLARLECELNEELIADPEAPVPGD